MVAYDFDSNAVLVAPFSNCSAACLNKTLKTLFQRLSQWRKRAREDEMLHAIHKRKKYPETLKLFIQRIKIARDIADAFAYLHDTCNVFHLDLKPGNIGFCSDGCLKVFDFGLAVEVQPESDSVDETFDLNGKKGTR